MAKKIRHIGFKTLDAKIDRFYRKKGYSKKRASYIARATAGIVARRKGK